MNAPCLNCPDRHEKCHGHCEKYLTFRSEKDKENQTKLIRNNAKKAADKIRSASRIKGGGL